MAWGAMPLAAGLVPLATNVPATWVAWSLILAKNNSPFVALDAVLSESQAPMFMFWPSKFNPRLPPLWSVLVFVDFADSTLSVDI